MAPRKYPTDQKTTTPEGKREYDKLYRREVREQERETIEQGKATIDEMTYENYVEMQRAWAIDELMKSQGWTREHAEAYVDEYVNITKSSFAEAKAEGKDTAEIEPVKSAIFAVDSKIQSRAKELFDAGLLESCLKVRIDLFKEDTETANDFCSEILHDPLFCSLYKKQLDAEKTRESTIKTYMAMYQESREDATRRFESSSLAPKTDVFTEFGERVYITQKLFGVDENYAKRYVTSDMVNEGKFADVTKPIYSRISVGDLYGKTKEQTIKDDAAQEPNTRTTVGNLYGKSREEKDAMSKSEEQFREFENQQRKHGVTMPSNKQEFPAPGRTTVGSTYGKTRKQILEEQKQQEEEQK